MKKPRMVQSAMAGRLLQSSGLRYPVMIAGSPITGCSLLVGDVNYSSDFSNEFGVGYDWRNDKAEWDLDDSWQAFSVAARKIGSISRYARVNDMRLANANHTYSFELGSGIDGNRDDGTGGLGPGNLALSDVVRFAVGPFSILLMRSGTTDFHGTHLVYDTNSDPEYDVPIIVVSWDDETGINQEAIYRAGAEFVDGDQFELEIIINENEYPLDITLKFKFNSTVMHEVDVDGIEQSTANAYWNSCEVPYLTRIVFWDGQAPPKVSAQSLSSGMKSFAYAYSDYTHETVKPAPDNFQEWTFEKDSLIASNWNTPTQFNGVFTDFEVASGSLPSGVSIDTATGSFTGTATDDINTTGEVNIKAVSGDLVYYCGSHKWRVDSPTSISI